MVQSGGSLYGDGGIAKNLCQLGDSVGRDVVMSVMSLRLKEDYCGESRARICNDCMIQRLVLQLSWPCRSGLLAFAGNRMTAR